MISTATLRIDSSSVPIAGLTIISGSSQTRDSFDGKTKDLDPFRMSWTELLKSLSESSDVLDVENAIDGPLIPSQSDLSVSAGDRQSPADERVIGEGSPPAPHNSDEFTIVASASLQNPPPSCAIGASAGAEPRTRRSKAILPCDSRLQTAKQSKPSDDRETKCVARDLASAGCTTLNQLPFPIDQPSPARTESTRHVPAEFVASSDIATPSLSPDVRRRIQTVQSSKSPDSPTEVTQEPNSREMFMKRQWSRTMAPENQSSPMENLYGMQSTFQPLRERAKDVGRSEPITDHAIPIGQTSTEKQIDRTSPADSPVPLRSPQLRRSIGKEEKTNVTYLRETMAHSTGTSMVEDRDRPLAFMIEPRMADARSPFSNEQLEHGGSSRVLQSQGNPLKSVDERIDPVEMQWLHTNTRHAEAAFRDPSLGWVTVRAATGPGGMHASIIPASEHATEVLEPQVNGLRAHLLEAHFPIERLTLQTHTLTSQTQPESFGDQTYSGANSQQRDNHQAFFDGRDLNRPGSRNSMTGLKSVGEEGQDLLHPLKDEFSPSCLRISWVA